MNRDFICMKMKLMINKQLWQFFYERHLYAKLQGILCCGLTRVMFLLHVNSLWLCILYSFFTSAADQKIIFMFLITTKQVRNTVKVSALNSVYLQRNSQKSDS